MDDHSATWKQLMKPTLLKAEQTIRDQISWLSDTLLHLEDKNHNLFSQVVVNLKEGKIFRSSVMANELVELRKITRIVIQTKLVLEQIELRICTVTEMGDWLAAVAPVVSTVKNLKKNFSGVVPQAKDNLLELSSIMGDILNQACNNGYSFNSKAVNQDADFIIAEAAAVAEKIIKERFPELPNDIIMTLNKEVEMT